MGCIETSPNPVLRRELPGPHVILVLDLAGTVALCHGAAAHRGEVEELTTRPTCARGEGFIVGLSRTASLTQTTGHMEAIEVGLTPLGAAVLLGVAGHSLVDRATRASDVLRGPGSEVQELVGRLRDSPSWSSRFAILDAFFLARIHPRAEVPSWLEYAWETISGHASDLSVSRLAVELGYSRRHVTAVFDRVFGVGPKTAARLCRFARAAETLRLHRSSGASISLAGLAVENGYTDQSHLTREFRALGGITPSEYVRCEGQGQLGLPPRARDPNVHAPDSQP